jgi:hypothetical protein
MNSDNLFAPITDKDDSYKALLKNVLVKRFMVYAAGNKPTPQAMTAQDYTLILEQAEREIKEEGK